MESITKLEALIDNLDCDTAELYSCASEIEDDVEDLLSEIKDMDELVLFGPANMKKELEKDILNDTTLTSKLKAVVSADRMTENQMVAWVKKFYLSLNTIE